MQTVFPRSDGAASPITSGAEVLFRQDGATLLGPLRGHEHFGFRDGVSQPGVRGKLPDGSFLTPNQNPRDTASSLAVSENVAVPLSAATTR